MKKLINLLMALFVVFAIASCGAGAETEAPAVTEEPTEEVIDTTAAPAEDEAPAEEGEEAEGEEAEGEEAEAPAEEEEH